MPAHAAMLWQDGTGISGQASDKPPGTKPREEAIEIDPGLPVIYFVLAMIHAESGQDQKARDAVKSILEIDPKFSSHAYTQGMPFSDPALQTRRELALKKAGVPE